MSIPARTFYRRPDPEAKRLRAQGDAALRTCIEEILDDFPAYGYRRVTHELRRRGRSANRKRVARIMRVSALTPRRVRRSLATTDSDHDEPIYPNLVPSIRPSGPDQLWVADLTYIHLLTGFVYLAVVLDAWSRKVVGYAISEPLDTRLCLAALKTALEARHPPAGLIHHSDSGRAVRLEELPPSSQRAWHPGLNVPTGEPLRQRSGGELLQTLKHEEVFLFDYGTMEDVVQRLPRFLEEVYNRRRLHSSLGYLPPDEFETLHRSSAA